MRVQVSPLDGTAKLEGSGVSEWRNLRIEVRRRKKEDGEKDERGENVLVHISLGPLVLSDVCM